MIKTDNTLVRKIGLELFSNKPFLIKYGRRYIDDKKSTITFGIINASLFKFGVAIKVIITTANIINLKTFISFDFVINI